MLSPFNAIQYQYHANHTAVTGYGEAALKMLWLAINQVQEVSLMPRKLHHQLSDNYLIPSLLSEN